MIRWIHSGGFFEAVSILFGAGLAVASATGLGCLFFGRVLREWPERFVAGAAALSLIVFAICCVGLVSPAIFLVIGAVAGVGLWRNRAGAGETVRWPAAAILLGAIFAVYFYLYLMNAMGPEFSPDGSGYHLGLVSRYLREGGFHKIDWDMYATFPAGAEMLFLVAFAFGKHSAAALVHFAFLIALAWEIVIYGRRCGFLLQGACAALLVFASPLMGKDGTAAYNDVALAACAFVLFALLERWDTERAGALLAPIGLVAGFAFSVKYTAALGVVWAIGFVAWRAKERARAAAVVAGFAALVALPWLVKNWVWVGNPVAPLYNHWFPNPNFTTAFEADYRSYLAMYDLHSRWAIPAAVTVKGTLVGILGKVFKAAPLGLLALHRREGRRLWFAALVFGATYFSNIGARFLLPVLPFVAMTMAIALGTRVVGQAVAIGLALVHSYWSWPTVIPRYASDYVWRLHDAPWKWALRFRPAEEFLKERMPQYGLDRLIDRVTDPGATVLSYRAIPEAYTSRRILVDYESQFNHVAAETLLTAVDPGFAPARLATFSFSARAANAIRLVTGGSGQSQWRIYELRAFAGGAELSRERWRGDARPFPWEIGRAFDGDVATFWECGDYLRSGEEATVEFGKVQQLDRVTVQSGYAQGDVNLRLEARDGAGNWKVAEASAETSNVEPLDLRSTATGLLKKRGIGYVLLFDGDAPAVSMQAHPEDWGAEFVGESDGGRLYRLR